MQRGDYATSTVNAKLKEAAQRRQNVQDFLFIV
jgi:hypothetical protein